MIRSKGEAAPIQLGAFAHTDQILDPLSRCVCLAYLTCKLHMTIVWMVGKKRGYDLIPTLWKAPHEPGYHAQAGPSAPDVDHAQHPLTDPDLARESGLAFLGLQFFHQVH